jgi:hypothetical protein
MKVIKLKEVQVSPGMEYQITSYPGPGVYLVNGNQVIAVQSGYCSAVTIPQGAVDTMSEGAAGGGIPESFIFKLIDRTEQLLERAPLRAVRRTDIVGGA